MWLGPLNYSGYGQASKGSAHRLAYTLLVGEVPKGLQLDHLCRVRNCINPDHLEPVTARQNALRGEGLTAHFAKQTHCKRSHAFTVENTYFPEGLPPRRVCRICAINRARKQREQEWAAQGKTEFPVGRWPRKESKSDE